MDRADLALPSSPPSSPVPRVVEIRELVAPIVRIRRGIRELVFTLQIIGKETVRESPLVNIEVETRIDREVISRHITDTSGIVEANVPLRPESQAFMVVVPYTTAYYQRQIQGLKIHDLDGKCRKCIIDLYRAWKNFLFLHVLEEIKERLLEYYAKFDELCRSERERLESGHLARANEYARTKDVIWSDEPDELTSLVKNLRSEIIKRSSEHGLSFTYFSGFGYISDISRSDTVFSEDQILRNLRTSPNPQEAQNVYWSIIKPLLVKMKAALDRYHEVREACKKALETQQRLYQENKILLDSEMPSTGCYIWDLERHYKWVNEELLPILIFLEALRDKLKINLCGQKESIIVKDLQELKKQTLEIFNKIITSRPYTEFFSQQIQECLKTISAFLAQAELLFDNECLKFDHSMPKNKPEIVWKGFKKSISAFFGQPVEKTKFYQDHKPTFEEIEFSIQELFC